MSSIPFTCDFYSLGKQIFDPHIDAWWADYKSKKPKCIFFLFYDLNNPSVLFLSNTENQPHHQIKKSTAFEVFLALAANQIAHSPPTQQLQTWFSTDLLWCWGNFIYCGSDRLAELQIKRIQNIDNVNSCTSTTECFHRLFIHLGLNT